MYHIICLLLMVPSLSWNTFPVSIYSATEPEFQSDCDRSGGKTSVSLNLSQDPVGGVRGVMDSWCRKWLMQICKIMGGHLVLTCQMESTCHVCDSTAHVKRDNSNLNKKDCSWIQVFWFLTLDFSQVLFLPFHPCRRHPSCSLIHGGLELY